MNFFICILLVDDIIYLPIGLAIIENRKKVGRKRERENKKTYLRSKNQLKHYFK